MAISTPAVSQAASLVRSLPASHKTTAQAERLRLERHRLERLAPYLLLRGDDWASRTSWFHPWCLSRRKRTFDIVGASLSLILAAPVLLLAAIAIKLTSPGPVFFRQWRTGYAGRRFQLYKLRTMVQDADQLKESLRAFNHHAANSPDFKMRDDPRITPVGRILRKLSLDELPNFINVLRGEMSVVGPRPTSFDIDVYADHHLSRLAVPPGITGLWQISGRSEVDFDDRVKIDCRYIQEQSFRLDLRIVALTPFRVLDGRGAY